MVDSSDEDEAPIGDLQERLAQLRPSRQLLDYYRTKIAEYDGEHTQMMEKLDKYKTAYEHQVSVLAVNL